MSVKLRPGVPDDAAVCGQICYEAFDALAAAHGFPSDFPSAKVAPALAGMMLGHPGFYSLVGEVDGQVVGSNFMDERSPIVGIEPITVAPAAQDDGIGRALMNGALVRPRRDIRSSNPNNCTPRKPIRWRSRWVLS